MFTILKMCKEAHAGATEKGFWDKPRNRGELLMLIVSELGEALEALRHQKRQDTTYNRVWEKDTFEDELADAVIRIGDLCEAEGIDLEWQIRKKLEYNKTRPHKHGKGF